LVPLGAEIRRESDIEFETVHLGRLINGLRQSGGLNLVMLDACRNSPYTSSFRSSSRGLARSQPATGTMIFYATEPNEVAADGEGRNGILTGAFLSALSEKPYGQIEQVFKDTASRVIKETKGRQRPWSEGSILGEFRFQSEEPSVARPFEGETQVAEPVPEPVAELATELPAVELEFFRMTQSLNTPAAYEAYLDEYPSGRFSRLAQLKLEELKKQKAATTEPESHNAEKESQERNCLAEEAKLQAAEIERKTEEQQRAESEREARAQRRERLIASLKAKENRLELDRDARRIERLFKLGLHKRISI